MNESKWIAVTDTMPKPEQNVLAYYENSYGKNRIVRAYHVPKNCMEIIDFDYWDDRDLDYDEEKDIYYCPEGWYESNEHEEVNWRIDEAVTHWQPMPEPPGMTKEVDK